MTVQLFLTLLTLMTLCLLLGYPPMYVPEGVLRALVVCHYFQAQHRHCERRRKILGAR